MENFKKTLKSLSLLDRQEKRKFYILFVLMFFAYLLETASIGSIIPMLIFLSDSQAGDNFKFLNNLTFLENNSKEEKLQFFVMLFLFIFLIKNVYMIFYKWFQIKFITNLTINLSVKLYRKYLAQPYLFFVKHKSSTLIRNVIIETSKFSSNIVDAVTNLILEIIILLTISLFLFLYDPKSFTFITIVSFCTFLIFSLSTKNKLNKWSKERALFEGKVINKLQTGFNLSKIIKIFFQNNKFDKMFQHDVKKLFFALRNKNILNKIPRHLFEVIAVSSLTFLVIFLTNSGKQYGEIIVLLGLFAAAAYRIFPAIVNIVVSLQTIQFNSRSSQILKKEFTRSNFDEIYKFPSKKEITFKKDIILKNISFKFPEKTYNILNKLNLTIKKNQIVGITGASGSGKSTLIDILIGVLKPNSGELRVDGKKLADNEISIWSKIIGYVPQGVFLLDDTIEKNIAFGIDIKDIDQTRIVNSAKIGQIHDYIMSLPKKYKTVISEKGSNFSEGQKQRIAIARALYGDPKILILDEATSSLDTKTEKKFVKILKSLKKNKTIIIVAHRYSILKLCENVYFFDLNKKFKKVEKKFVKQIT